MEPITLAIGAGVVAGLAWWKKRHEVSVAPGAAPTPLRPKKPGAGENLKQGACKAEQLRDALAKKVGVITPPAGWDAMSCDKKLAWLFATFMGAPGFYAIAHAVLTSSEFNGVVRALGAVASDVQHAEKQVENLVKKVF